MNEMSHQPKNQTNYPANHDTNHEPERQHLYEIAVIGGGPVGMFAAFYAGLHSADVLLLESLSELGGQTGNLYPAKILYDIGGFTGISGQELVAQLEQQAAHFHPTIKTATNVQTIDPQPDGTFLLGTTNGIFHTKSVIIATGGGAFTPRKLACPYDPALEGTKLFYYVRDLDSFKGLDVAIAGGGDSAIDWALALAPIAKSVHLIHRRDQFRGLESSVDELHHSTVQLHTPFLIQGVTANGPRLDVTLDQVRGDETRTLNVDRLLVNYGFMSENRQLRNWPLTLEHNEIVVTSQMQTSTPGIFAVGDAVTYPGKVKLIASGFGEAPTAVNETLSFLYPERRQALHSTQLYH
ncbi:NAD(P)/FAD-dependent oxidoreductase [Paenibacillus farraposensis]|uniref:Ferredoxin--NADP reductase n=2 Tax=Bacilli TaxID=91061 RepID=A0ABW4DKJ3_9BACL|nr:NAD(P)/FAD-dependent oxidoreductase [Lacticaseibacillus yichunensis]